VSRGTVDIAHAAGKVLAEAFNVTNRRNWIGHQRNKPRRAQIGNPTAAAGAREIQLGVRVEY
jgi:hypothetical protein